MTGLVARILEQRPDYDASQVRNVLANEAEADRFTRAVPNPRWGYGKVDLRMGEGGAVLAPDLRIDVEALPAAVLEDAYVHDLRASGGTGPYGWRVSSGSLPRGLALDGRGQFTGAPEQLGVFRFTVSITDSSSQTVEHALELRVAARRDLHVTSDLLPAGEVDGLYEHTLEADGGVAPYGWSLEGGDLPSGLTMDGDGRLHGIFEESGSFNFTVAVSDSRRGRVLRSLRLEVRDPQTIGEWRSLGLLQTIVNQVAVDPRDPQHLVASTSDDFDTLQVGLFESHNGGDTWQPMPAFLTTEFEVQALGVSPDSDVWALSTEGFAYVVRAEAPGNYEFPRVCPFGPTPAFHPQAADIDFDDAGGVYIWCGFGTFRYSGDRGRTWSTLSDGVDAESGHLSLFHDAPETMVRTAQDGVGRVLRSRDGGASWQLIHEIAEGEGQVVGVQLSQDDADDVAVAIQTGERVVLRRSVDGGAGWSEHVVTLGGTACCLARAKTDPSVLMLGSDRGLFVSEDHGVTWRAVPINGQRQLNVSSVAIDPSDTRLRYVGSSQGVFRSDDAGASWTWKSRGLLMRTFTGLAVSPLSPEDALLGTTSGTHYLSRTGGERWALSKLPFRFLDALDAPAPVISASDPNVFFLARQPGGLYKSTDRGLTWSSISPSLVAYDADPFNASNVLVARFTFFGPSVWRSTDGGASWSQMAESPEGVESIHYARDVPGRVLAASPTGLFASDDGGGTWTKVLDPPTGVVAASPNDSRYVYASESATVYANGAGTSWTESTLDGVVLSLAGHLELPETAYAGIVGGLFRTDDAGASWRRVPGNLDGLDVVSVTPHPLQSSTLYATTRAAGVFISNDGGDSWSSLGEFATLADRVNVTAVDPTDASVLFAGTEGFGVQVSTDGGRSFEPRVSGLTNLNINTLVFDAAVPSTVYAGSDGGLFKSENSGGHWVATDLDGEITDFLSNGDGTSKRDWALVAGQGVAFVEADRSTVHRTGLPSLELTSLDLQLAPTERLWVAARGGGVSYSDDLGQTWFPARRGLPDDVNDVRVDPGANRIWAATDVGVFFAVLTDAPELDWMSLSTGLPPGRVSSLSIDPNTGELFASVASADRGGVYRGANVLGFWTPFNDGLSALDVRRLTNDGGRAVNASTIATSFYASTWGEGIFSTEVRSVAGSAPAVTTEELPVAIARAPYHVRLMAEDGSTPYRWSVRDGALAPGLTLDPSTGDLAGVPALAGRFLFTVQVTDTSARSDTKTFVLEVVADPHLSVGGVTVLEGDGASAARFTIVLSRPTPIDVHVDYSTPGEGTATPGTDYEGVSGTLRFAPGELAHSVDVPILGDTLIEPDESFVLRLASPRGAALSISEAVGTIETDDPAELAADFGAHGTFFYGKDTWSNVSTLDPERLTRWGDRVIGAYPGRGTYVYEFRTGWRQITTWVPEHLATWGDALVGAFGVGRGVYRYDGAAWTKLHDAAVENVVPFGAQLAIDLGAAGVWVDDGGGWTSSRAEDPSAMREVGGKLVASFADGVWELDGGVWEKLHEVEPRTLGAWSGKLVAVFEGSGLWHHDGSEWHELNALDPTELSEYDGKLVAAFPAWGLWAYDGIEWDPLTPWEPEGFTTRADALYADFGPRGVWALDATGWRQITTSDAEALEAAAIGPSLENLDRPGNEEP